MFTSLLFFEIEQDRCFDFDYDSASFTALRPRVLLKKLGIVGLGDRWVGEVSISGNELRIGPDKGVYAGRSTGNPFSGSTVEKRLLIPVPR